MKKLSILICHLEAREEKLLRLLNVLNPQVNPRQVEVLIETDNGEMPIGDKRNLLLEKSEGEYTCFIDDDDLVPEYYVKSILDAINYYYLTVRDGSNVISGRPDVIGIKGHYIPGASQPQVFIHSIAYDNWFTAGGIHYRCPNHLNPVRRELALEAGFISVNHGEDMAYSLKLLPFLQTEIFIDKVMYKYIK